MSPDTPLSGVRIWLSGSVPSDADTAERDRLEHFTKTFTSAAFREGASIVHGCHPTLMRPLLAAASEYREATRRKAPLVLMASAWHRAPNGGLAGVDYETLRRESELASAKNLIEQLCYHLGEIV